MPYYLVKDFVRGLDVRRMIETSEPGSLIVAKNCVITRGGEIERRRAWTRAIELPPDTFGLWYEAGIPGVWHVFGSNTDPVMPTYTQYHQLLHPDGFAMTAVRCVREFNKKLFVVAQFSDNSVLCYFDGVLVIENPFPEAPPVDDEVDPTPVDPYPVGQGRPTARFRITRSNTHTGTVTAASALLAGSYGFSGSWTSEQILPTGTAIAITADDTGSTIATKIADAINANGTPPPFHAKAVDNELIISFAAVGATKNGYMLILGRAPWDMFNEEPNYNIFSGGMNTATTTLDGLVRGLDPHAVADHWSPGQFVLQHKTKMFAVAGDSGILNVSALNAPDIWTPDATGAGFIDMSQQSAGRSTLLSLAQFQGKLAIFADNAVFVWYMDPDLAQSSEVTVLDNTGTRAPRSVLSYGNSDVFYLSPTGIRSLQSRDVNGEAFASDIGNPIDQLVQEQMAASGFYTFLADAAIEPNSGRYLLAFGSRVFVFNYFAQTKIAAWTEWDVGFNVADLISSGGRLTGRSDVAIYVYADFQSLGVPDRYDNCTVEVQLPYLAAGKPAHQKSIFGVDIAAENDWNVEVGIDYSDPDFLLPVGLVQGTTFREQRIGLSLYATHVSFRLTCTAPGYARLGNLAFHFHDGEEAG